MRPQIDASNKQIFAENKYKNSIDAIIDLVEESSNKQFLSNVFRPTRLGEFSMGGNFFSVNRSENPNEQLRDFPLKYIMNEGKGNHLP